MGRPWFSRPGVVGDRALEEQLAALRPALAECAGKTVADLGCAEGFISLEFAKAGAIRVLGIEREAYHLELANRIKYPAQCILKFKQWNMQEANPDEPLRPAYDIVLCLAIIHKLEHPETGLRFAARSCKDLLLLRSGRGSVNGIIRGKFSGNKCDSASVLRQEGFELEKTIIGPKPHKEAVEYFRRIK